MSPTETITSGPQFTSRPRDDERTTRKPLPLWDRVKFLLLALVWGASFLLIKIGTEALAPLQITLGRMVFGAIPLAIVLVLTAAGFTSAPM
jgi:hypothetical protein